jgi:hypothetical protein
MKSGMISTWSTLWNTILSLLSYNILGYLEDYHALQSKALLHARLQKSITASSVTCHNITIMNN